MRLLPWWPFAWACGWSQGWAISPWQVDKGERPHIFLHKKLGGKCRVPFQFLPQFHETMLDPLISGKIFILLCYFSTIPSFSPIPLAPRFHHKYPSPSFCETQYILLRSGFIHPLSSYEIMLIFRLLRLRNYYALTFSIKYYYFLFLFVTIWKIYIVRQPHNSKEAEPESGTYSLQNLIVYISGSVYL